MTIRAIVMALALGIAAILAPLGGMAQTVEQPRHGLMWNRTGLPAVFPLIVRTDASRNHYLMLRDAGTGVAALAAFIEGGRHFRVLVPPGTYDVRLASGTDWQGEAELFGAGEQTRILMVSEPLTFAVQSFSTKGGHLLDLRGRVDAAGVKRLPYRICQTLRLEPGRVRQRGGPEAEADPPDTELTRAQELLAPDVVYPDDDAQKVGKATAPRFEVHVSQC